MVAGAFLFSFPMQSAGCREHLRPEVKAKEKIRYTVYFSYTHDLLLADNADTRRLSGSRKTALSLLSPA
jgi:hypothetical protein